MLILLSLPAIIMASACLYNGIYYVTLYARRRNEKESLTFALTCFSVAFYDICCAGLYNSVSLFEGMKWQAGQFFTICMISASIIWFTKDFTKSKSSIVEKISLLYYSIMAVVVIAISNELTLSITKPAIKNITLGRSLKITYYECTPGILVTIMFITSAFLFAYLIYRLTCYHLSSPKQKARLIIFSFFLFYMAIINDILIGEGLHSFIYLAEYAFMGIVLIMGYALQNRFINIQEEVEMLNANLEKKVEERTKQLEGVQQELVENAHKAGMADIATGTVHNIGNILNSVMTSTHFLEESASTPILEKFKKGNSLLRENMDNLKDFIVNNPKGKKLLEYYLELEKLFEDEHLIVKTNIERLTDKVNAIHDVVVAQQSYAGAASLSEECDLSELIDHALIIQKGSIERFQLTIEKEYTEIPKVKIQKTKFLHIVINLIKNAKDSLADTTLSGKLIKIYVAQEKHHVYVKISDNGPGIKPENITKIFNHGFSTKADGTGIGLHSCANYISEMGGKIWAESDGENKGATFVLEFKKEKGQAQKPENRPEQATLV